MAKAGLFLVLILTVIQTCLGARILCVTAIPSYSHSVFYWPIFKALAERGHELVVLTTDTRKDVPSNIKQIDWHYAYEIRHKIYNITNTVQQNEYNLNKILNSYEDMFRDIMNAELSHPAVTAMIRNKTEHFDLLMVEILMTPMYYFSVRFKCPYIVLSSTDLPNFIMSSLGNPSHPFEYPEAAPRSGNSFGFVDRLIYVLLSMFLRIRSLFGPMFQWTDVTQKHFGHNIPDASEVLSNVSMIFMNTHPVLSTRPLGPGFVTLGGGTHLQPLKPLPEDIKTFLDNADEGAIYFSLGTNVLDNHLTPEIIQTFVETFNDLPYKVLWKFESDVAHVTDKVKIIRWGPQQDILRHKNIKLFITQCGSQSLEESLLSQVPMVGIPFVSDQSRNAVQISSRGVAKILSKKTITKESFKEAILEVIKNPSYKENAVKISQLLQDNPMHPVDKAVWWTEYVLRHKGTPHFWNKHRNIPSWEYYFLDSIAFVLAIISVVLFISYKVIKRIVIFTYSTTKLKLKVL